MNDQPTSGDSGSAFPSWSPDWATRGLMGSQSVPFQPTPMVAEGSTTEVQMMHISAMPHYQHISGEELRSEIFGLGPSTGPPNSLAGFASNPCASSSSLGLFSWANDASIPTTSGWTSSALTSSPFRASPLFSFQPLLPGRTATSINFGGPSLGTFSGSSAFSATGFPKNSSAESAFNQTLNPFASMSLSPQPLASGVSTSLFNFAQPTSSFGDRPLFPSSVSSFPSFSFLQSPSFPRSQPQAPPQASAAGVPCISGPRLKYLNCICLVDTVPVTKALHIGKLTNGLCLCCMFASTIELTMLCRDWYPCFQQSSSACSQALCGGCNRFTTCLAVTGQPSQFRRRL